MDHRRWTEALGRIGWAEDDSDDVRLQKSTLTLCTALIVVVASVWVGIYWSLGLALSAAIPLSYQVVSVIGLAVFARTKRLPWLRNLQLALMLLLPFALQWTLGGFVAGSAVCLWALASAMGGVMFGARPWPWFGGFLALLTLSALLDPLLTPAPVPHTLRLAFFVLNVGVTALVVFMVLGYFLRQRDAARAALAEEHRKLEAEREKSERLLLNVLPAAVVERLKEGEEVIADAGDVSVLFADLLDFTRLSARLDPRAVVRLLNGLFSSLDELAGQFGLEKIKTIGDAYMAVAGLPIGRPDHATAAAEMALAVAAGVPRFGDGLGGHLQVRIGIDSGPAIAGVIGRRKFSYDLWGDTVNTASRMESHGSPGRIQVTQRVVTRLEGLYRFEPRGEIEVKGKGRMQTWYLVGRLADAAGEPSSQGGAATADATDRGQT